jgi:hypothetical protein
MIPFVKKACMRRKKMNEDSVKLHALAKKLERMEIQNNKRNLIIIVLAMVVLTGGFSLTMPLSPKVIIAEKIHLVDKNGITRLKIELEDGSPQISMSYDNGDPSLSMSGEELCFYDKSKRARINIVAKNNINSSSLSIIDKEGNNRVSLCTGPEGPYLSFDEGEEHKQVILSIDPIGTLNGIESYSGKGDRKIRGRRGSGSHPAPG